MYYPNLRVKAGELKALSHAPDEWQDKIHPIWNVEFLASFEKAIPAVASTWPDGSIMDLSRFHLKRVSAHIQQTIVQHGLRLAIDPFEISDLHSSVIAAFEANPIFRVAFNDDVSIFDDTAFDELETILSPYADVDNTLLLIDIGEADETMVSVSTNIARVIEKFHDLGFSNIVFSSGAFPTTLQNIVGDEEIPRLDKELYDNVTNSLTFDLHYGDYGTLSPLWDSGETRRSGHIAIKYTLDGHWLVLRQKGKNTQAIMELAEFLILHPDYRGSAFSWADKNWHNKTLTPPQAGPGNSTGHVAEFMNHHFAQVLFKG
ncbi:hypothetical protein GMES_1380 [Paraglaciecola mesophila KMM 241]|uniref:Beta protein n=1 Tax=Paraglaciecola mesophila KMM 241 TaxID=1128912 RepID=K6XST1_9ALTE|nr:hypothetical protein [Paraglaciecola mesophila]GAC23679.1 hypothetical protein GMES_1380 [Paraglaciecola mesophila KMM 241]